MGADILKSHDQLDTLDTFAQRINCIFGMESVTILSSQQQANISKLKATAISIKRAIKNLCVCRMMRIYISVITAKP